MKNIPSLLFTVGFITNQDKVLMLHRNKAPNQGKWNGVGGHIEIGESPYDSMLREIEEETGLVPDSIQFGGILTWEGFEINTGGLYIFSATVNSWKIRENGEGILKWQPIQFAFSHPDVVDNIHYFLPPVLAGATPLHYHFTYQNSVIIERNVSTLPKEVDIFQIFTPPL
ncbi:MAG: DNA mismatch repair protein MutT [Chloroflexi bacterium HGW-Chloroflexi-8]|jgi:8-oxo-dGTP diphosphatase|nr:MAG: DNA mismatch repair protein MutT [Chloroflexi bacterium HGW-Chloroflexi-8]